MDAASNNSVEDIRSIREKINFLPTRAKYRVYIIDEVHMLSTGAFNALLKTLEEPPEHVKFILATTEPQKLLTTILSRCQRFDFKRISDNDLIKRMKVICNESNINITDTALSLIATLSEGAARDALSILERCLQDGENNIDENKIKELVGIPKFVYVNNIVKGIIDRDIEKSLQAMQDVIEDGKDLENFLWEMIKYVKDILVYKVSKINDFYNKEEIKQISEIAESIAKEDLINIIYILSELENKMKWSSQKKIIFETEIIKLCMDSNKSDLEKRITELEYEIGKIKNGSIIHVKENESEKNTKQINIQNKKIEKTTQKIEKKEQKTEKGNIIDNWKQVLENLKKQGKVMLYANLVNTEAVEINDMTVLIRFFNGLNSFREKLLKQSENMNILTKEISIICGKQMEIKLEDASEAKNTYVEKNKTSENTKEDVEKEDNEDILNSLDIPINIIEE